MPTTQPELLATPNTTSLAALKPINRRQPRVNPEVLRWALERSGKTIESHPPPKSIKDKVQSWLDGVARPSYAQLRVFARYTYVGLPRLLDLEPPKETISIADFRSKGGNTPSKPSGELLDLLYDCQIKQLWYDEYSVDAGIALPEFPGTISPHSDVEDAARTIRGYINWQSEETLEDRKNRWEGAVRSFRQKIEDAGVLVMSNTRVGNHSARKLNPDEFRGFSLTYGNFPLIFINKRDAISAQMFSLGHELAHIFSDTPGLSKTSYTETTGLRSLEGWCNAVAAELLVPADQLKTETFGMVGSEGEVRALAYRFAVSRAVILYRLRSLSLILPQDFTHLEQREMARAAASGGGRTSAATRVLNRLGRRFCHAVVSSTITGETLEDEAFDLLEIRSDESFAGLVAALDLA